MNSKTNTALTAWIAEARYEALRAIRRPAYFVPVLILPIGFFLMFGVALARQNGGMEATIHVLVGYAIFGVLAATVMGLAAAVATEREFGLLQLKRALPMPPGAYLGAKVLTALAIAATVNVLLAILAITLGHVRFEAWQWATLLAVHLVGGIPFAALGLFIGSRISAAAAPGVANAVYLPLSFLGGLWVPLQFLPPFFKQIAQALPSYHLSQISLAVIGRADDTPLLAHAGFLAIFGTVFFFLARRGLMPDAAGTERNATPKLRQALRAAAIVLAVCAVFRLVSQSSSVADGDVPAPLTPADRNSFAIHKVRVFDGEHLVENLDVIVRDGRIEAVGPDAPIPAGMPVVEGRNRTLLPGLIDAHTHSYGPARRQALRFGVTTELDMFTDWHSLADARRQRESLAKTAQADLYSAGTLATVPHGHGTEYGMAIPTLTTPEEAPAFVDARLAEGSDYLKIILEDGSAYHHVLPTLDVPTLTALVAAAHARGKLAVAHVATEAEARQAIEAGIDGLAHVFIDQPADDAIVALAKQHGVFVTATLSVAATAAGADEGAKLANEAAFKPYFDGGQRQALKASFPEKWRVPDFLPNAIESVRRLHAAGVPILAGTDAGNPGTTHGATLHQELALLVRAGLTPTEALNAATALPARCFKLADRGRIAPGARADLLLVEGDPTVDIAATRAIVGIWKNGYAVDRSLSERERSEEVRGADAPTDLHIADFEDGAIAVRFGQNFTVSTDQFAGGKSQAEQHWQAGGAHGSKGALAVSGTVDGGLPYAWSGTLFLTGSTPMQAVDLSRAKELVFWFRGDGREDEAMLFSGAPGNQQPSVVRFPTTTEWQEIHLPLSRFAGADPARLRGIAFTATLPVGTFSFALDDVELR